MLSFLLASRANNTDVSTHSLTKWLCDSTSELKNDYTLSEAIQLIAELEQLWQDALPLDDSQLVTLADFSSTISNLHS